MQVEERAATIQTLIADLSQGDAGERSSAVRRLVALGGADVIRALTDTLQHRVRNARWAAVIALEQIGDPAAGDSIIRSLQDPDPAVRLVAAETSAKLGGARAVKPLATCLRDSDADVRLAAASSLAKLGDAMAVEALLAHRAENWAQNALHRIALRQQPLLQSFPDLLCRECFQRPMQKLVPGYEAVVCRGCGCSSHLQTTIRSVIGRVGLSQPEYEAKEGMAHVVLWLESSKAARNADIDALWIDGPHPIHYDWALQAVINTLHNDVGRPKPLKEVPVRLIGNPPLSDQTRRLLENTFAGSG